MKHLIFIPRFSRLTVERANFRLATDKVSGTFLRGAGLSPGSEMLSSLPQGIQARGCTREILHTRRKMERTGTELPPRDKSSGFRASLL